MVRIELSNHHLVYSILKFRGNVQKQYDKNSANEEFQFRQIYFRSSFYRLEASFVLFCRYKRIVSNWTHMLTFGIEKHDPWRERRVSDKLGTGLLQIVDS